ncbi:MAG: hypothetical protein AAF594_04835 [Bacteroidota bacterium]
MLRLLLSLLVLLVAWPATAQRVLLVADQDRLTMQLIHNDLTAAQRQWVDDGQAVVVGRVGDESWCIGCSLKDDAQRSASEMQRAGRDMARLARAEPVRAGASSRTHIECDAPLVVLASMLESGLPRWMTLAPARLTPRRLASPRR